MHAGVAVVGVDEREQHNSDLHAVRDGHVADDGAHTQDEHLGAAQRRLRHSRHVSQCGHTRLARPGYPMICTPVPTVHEHVHVQVAWSSTRRTSSPPIHHRK